MNFQPYCDPNVFRDWHLFLTEQETTGAKTITVLILVGKLCHPEVARPVSGVSRESEWVSTRDDCCVNGCSVKVLSILCVATTTSFRFLIKDQG